MNDQTDISAFIRSLQGDARYRAMQAAMRATAAVAEMILAEARELAPVSPTNPQHPHYIGTSGALRDSGTVTPAVPAGDTVQVEIGFDTNYAAAVHERLDAVHKYPGAVNPNAQAKYLSTALKSNLPRARQYVQKEIEKAF